jgi:type IV secretion system protein VirB3
VRDPIFKGCTRPAMLAGVPMQWMLGVSGGALLAAPWLLYGVHPAALLVEAAIYIAVFLWMRETTRRDDQRLRQLSIRALMRARQIAGRRLWGAVSYSPLRYKRRGMG